MFKLFSIFSISALFQGHAANQSILTFIRGIPRAFKAVNQRTLSTISTTLMLSVLLSACGGGGGGGETTPTPTPTPTPTMTPTLSVLFPSSSVNEDFPVDLVVATATNATDIRVSQSSTGVVNVTTSVTDVSVSSIPNANGRTTLTITATNSSGSTTAQVIVTVIAINDPPTLTVSSNSISTVGGFSPITINTTASDVEDANITFTVSESTTGVVRVTQSANAIVLNTIAGASGQTTLTVSVVDSSGSTVTQTIVVNVAVTVSAAPMLMVSTNSINVQEDFSSVVIRTTASDSDSATLTLTVTPSMRLVNVAISTRTNDLSTITLTAIANLNGTATLTFRATDGGGQTNSTEIVVVVAAVNDPPTITISTPTLTVLEDFDGTNSVATYADVDRGDALTVTVTESNPGVVTVTTSASGVSVSAIANRNGRTTLNISVSDGTLRSTAQVVVDVTPVNDPPVLSVSTSALILAEDFGTFLIATTRSDVDGDTLTLAVSESASGIVSVSTSSAGVQLRSTNNISGVTTLTITLSDGTTSTSTQVSVTVTAVNDAPTLDVSTTALTLNEDFATTQLITVNRSDIENDTLTLSVAESISGIVSVSTSSAGIQVVSIANANGQTTLTITVSDSNASVSTQVLVTVNAVNDPPTLSVSSNSISTVGGFSPITINTTANDIEDANISFAVIDANTRVVRVTTSAEAIVLNSIPGASGQTTLTVRVVDSSGATVTEIITVNVSITPSVAPVLMVSTNLISVIEDFRTSVIIQTTATDVDGDTITVSVSASMPIVTAVISTPVNAQSIITNSITLTAIGNANGTATLTVLAADSGGQSTNTEIVVVVSSVEDAPTLTIPTATLTVPEDFANTLTIATANDADGDTLLISVVESTTGIVTVTTTASGVSVSSILNANGQTTLTITVNDGTQDTTAQVVVTVTPVNDPPTLNVPSATLTRLEDFSGSITVATASDVDSTILTFTVTESTIGLIGVTTSASDVGISSRGDANGVTTLVVTVSDGRLSTTAQVVVTVTPVNDPPALSVSTAALTLNEDFATPVLIGTTRTDIDSNTLTLSVVESATGVVTVTITDAGVQVANIADTNGVTTLSISLSDGELSTTAQVVVTVTPVNDPPTLSVSTTALTLNEDFAATEVITVIRSDIDSNSLTLTVSESTTGVVTVTTTVAGVEVTNINNANGATTLTITLSDGTTSTSTQVGVTVTPVNDPPALSVSTIALMLNEDFATPVLIGTTRTDIDSNTLTLSVVESATGVVTVTITDAGVQVANITNINGVTTLTISLSDGELNTTAQVVVTVTPVNDPPALSVSTTALTLNEDFATPVLIGTTRTDIDSNALTLTVSESTTGRVSVTTTTAGVQVTNINNANGVTTLTISLSDGEFTTTAQVVVTVTPVNDPPTLSVSTTVLTLNEDFATAEVITVNSNDIDSNTLTLTVAESTTGVVTVLTSTSGISVSSIRNINGRTTLTITLSDSQLSTTTQVVIDVTGVNDPPVLTVSTTALTLNEDFATTQLITVNRSDIENDTLTLSVAESMSGIVSVSTSSAGIQVVRIANANGQTTLTITVSDGKASVSTQVLVTVDAINDPPTLTVSSNSITTVGGFSPITINTTASDIEDANISFTVIDAKTGVVTVTTSTNAVVLNTISGASGQTTLTVRVVDSSGATVTQFIVVNVTIRPSIAAPVVTVSTNLVNVQEDFRTSVFIQTTATDADGDTITVSVSASMPFVNAVISTPVNGRSIISNRITLTAIGNANGTATLTVLAADSGGQSQSTEIVVVVSPVEDTPTLTIPSTTLIVAEDFASTLTIATANDADGDTLLVSVVESTTGVVTVTTSASAVSVSSILNANGQTTLTITVNDGTQDTTAQVVVNVTPVNDPPVLNVPSATLTRLEDFSGAITVATASDVDSTTLTFTVTESITGLISVTTSASDVRISSRGEANGVITLDIAVSDGEFTTTAQVVVTVTAVNDPPVLTVSTMALTLAEDFISSVVIRTTATDADGDTITLSVSSSSRLVDVVLSTPVSGVSTITNMITLTALTDLNGTTTLTVQAIDAGGIITTEQIVVVVNAVDDPIPFTLSTTSVTLSVHGSQLDRIVNAISISNPDNKTLRAQIGVTASGDNIFSANPSPMVSFTTNALTAVTTLTSSTPTAQLYFTVAPNQTGTATLTVHLTNLDDSSTSQQTMVVSVNSPNVPPVIVPASSSITNLVVHGGRLYANDTMASDIGISRFLTTARALGGHLMNINSVEEYSFMRSTASGLVIRESWLGLVLPQRTFPGELSWMTHDSTIAYGHSLRNGETSLTVYPGHFNLTWFPAVGLSANRYGRPTTVANWTIHALGNGGTFFLIDDGGDGFRSDGSSVSDRNVIYEFPQGLPIASNLSPINVVSNASVRLTGYDLNGDTITTSNWRGTDSNGGSVSFTSVSLFTGNQTVDMVYTPSASFGGQTTVVVTLTAGGLSTTSAITFMVTPPPTIVLSSNAITLDEDFGTFDIATTATEQGVSTSLPFSVQASPSGIVTITTSANNIRLSAVPHASGMVTLTVRTTDSASLTTSTQVVVIVTPVNDPPTLSVSTTVLTFNEDFATTEVITVSRSDIDSNTLTLTVSESTTGVVSVTTTAAGVQVTNINNANGATTLTVTISDGTTSTSTQVGVTVTPVNDPPILSVSINNLAINIGFTPITINVTLSDVEDSTLSFSVVDSNAGVVTFTTSTNTIVLNAIAGVSGQTTLTVSLVDSSGITVTQTISVNVSPAPNTASVLVVSTNRITVQEDFIGSVVIRTTATDADGDTITLSVSSSSRLVDVVLSTPVSGVSTITNMITLTALTDLNGTTTLTVQATDAGGITTTEQIVVVVNAVDDPIPFSLSTSMVTLSVPGSQLDRIVNAISISNPDNKTLRAQIRVTTSGDNIFSTNPAPVASFTTNALTTAATLTPATSTAQLYFTIAPERIGTATLVVQLTDLDTLLMSQQTMVVQVNSVDVPPVIVQSSSDLANLVVHGGRLYANDVRVSDTGISRFLNTASALGGHLLNIDSIEEYSFVRSPANSGLLSSEAYFGLVLPARTFPGELSWITHDSTIAYGYASANGLTNLTVYPGHATLPWATGDAGIGLLANRFGPTTTVSNWPIFSDGGGGVIYLIDNGGDIPARNRNVIYEFPQGLPTASNSTPINVVGSATIRLTGFDLNGDTITTNDWSITDPNGGSAIFNNDAQSSGVQTVNMIYTPAANFNGQTTVVVSVQVGTLITTSAITFIVDGPPIIVLSTNAISLDEDFGTFDIATTATDQGVSTILPFSVQASTSGIVTITTSANNIRLSAVPNANGMVTLTVRTTDSASLRASTQVVVTVTPVNDPPTLSVSTTALTLNEDFATTEVITVSRSDIDSNTLTLTVSESTTGVVSVTTTAAGVQVTNINNANGATTLTITISDGTTSTSTQVGVTVTPVNDPPILSVSINNLAINIGFTPITINVTLGDVEDSTLSFSVEDSNAGVVTFTTSANTIVLNAIAGVSGQTTLTVSLVDSSGITVTQTISVIVSPTPNTASVLVVSTNRITVQEDFIGSVVIRTTATDSDGDTITLSVSSSSRLVDVVLSTPVSGVSTITNMITLTAITNLNGTTTLTVQATDSGGITTTEQIVVVVNAVDDPELFTLSISTVSLFVPGSQLDRIVNAISISNPDNKTLRVQIGVTASGDNIFSTNPTPVVSFTTNALTTTATLTSAASTAQLYFTIAPNQTGTATLTVHLTYLDDSSTSQQTMVVSVNALNVPPAIVPVNSSITNLVVHGGRLYANDVTASGIGISRFLTTANALGGHLVNINSVEEYTFVRSPASSGLTSAEAWLGLVLPNRFFPGELSWITHDSTIAYGYSNANDSVNLRVYPGHFPLPWNVGNGLAANRTGRPNTVFNWTIYAVGNGGVFFLVDDVGDSNNRNVIYEFPQGLPTIATHSTSIVVATSATVQLTGFDLNGDAISSSNWSITDPNGGSVIFNNVSQSSGVQTVDMVYTPRPNFDGQTTAVVTLQVNGLSTTYAISFIVDAPPTIALSTNVITLNEDFGTFDIGTTVTDQGVSTSLPFSVRASTSGIVTISTSANNIQLSAVRNANGPVTLTIQSIDSVSQSTSALIVVNVQAVNDPPTLTVSTNNISILGGASIIIIGTTATDVEDGPLSFSVQSSTTGVFSITTSANAIALDSIYNTSGQTTLTVTAVDRSNTTVVQTIAVNVIIIPSATPVLTVSTNLIRVDEDFSSPVVIRTTSTDADGDALIVSISSSSYLVDAVLSPPINGVSTMTNSITLTSITDLNGTTTLTVRATDGGGISSTEQIVVVVNPVGESIPFVLSTSVVTLSAPGSQLDRIVNGINISNPSNKTLSAQLQVTSSGDPIFSANPAPVVSFTTNALTTVTMLTSTTPTAQLYFTIAPNSTGTATLTVHLTNLATSESTQQTLVVQVNPVNVPPVIAQYSSDLTGLVVYGGRLYANDVSLSSIGISRFLTTASALGGHLLNINSIEEYAFMRSPASSGLLSREAYFGLVLAQRLFPGELSWMTHDSTIAYGYASTNGVTNLTVYPGQYPLPWAIGIDGIGLLANRTGNTATVSNWPIFADVSGGVIYLVDNGGDIPARDRNVIYEFPQGLPTASNSMPINVVSNVAVRLTGYDLNGDAINIPNWSGTDSNGGSVSFTSVSLFTGNQTVDMVYTPPVFFGGQTTVVVTLTVGGLSTTSAITFMVTPPTIVLSTNAITLDEDFGIFDIATNVTEQGSTSLPFSVQASPSGIVTITTSANNIRLSAVPNANGMVTLTVRTTDSASLRYSTQVVVTVRSVNDAPVLTVSTTALTLLEDFTTAVVIATTRSDVDGDTLTLTVFTFDLVRLTITTSGVRVTSLPNRTGQTTLTITLSDGKTNTSVRVAVSVKEVNDPPALSIIRGNISLFPNQTQRVIVNARDFEDGTLPYTVSHSTPGLVTVAISTDEISISPIPGVSGQTILTLRAVDSAGAEATNTITVDVVNNFPPFFVLSAILINLQQDFTDPVFITASAFDLDGDTVTLSVSTTSNIVDVAISTLTNGRSTITLSAIPNAIGITTLTIQAMDAVGQVTTVNVVVVVSPLIVNTGIKTLNFSWNAITSATHYQLQSEPMNGSGFVDLSTTGVVVSPNSTNIRQTTAQALVALHRYIPNVTNPQYGLKSCDATSCGVSLVYNTISLTNAQLNSMIGRLLASNRGFDRFGGSVSLSGDGNTLAVGAVDEDGSSTGVNGLQNNDSTDTGAVYVFRRNGGAWSQQAYIKASNTGTLDDFGSAVSLSSDGNTLAVGASLEDGSSTGVNGSQDNNSSATGAVYLFRFNTTSNIWSQQAYIKASNSGDSDQFGGSVDLSDDGNTLAVGAPGEDGSSTGVNGLQNNDSTDTGAVYLFRFSSSIWSQQAYIKVSNTGQDDQLGQSVSLSADGNTLAVGARLEDGASTGVNVAQNNNSTDTGAVYVFRFSSSIWSQQAYIKASNTGADDRFGQSVSLSANGNTLAVGAIFEDSLITGVNGLQNNNASNSGAVYLFRFSTGSSTWTQQAYIKASNTGTGDQFGQSVSLSADGNILAVGAVFEDGSGFGVAPADNNGLADSGATYVFEFANGTWAQQAYIKSSLLAGSAEFGISVSLSNDGHTLAVGTTGANEVYLY